MRAEGERPGRAVPGLLNNLPGSAGPWATESCPRTRDFPECNFPGIRFSLTESPGLGRGGPGVPRERAGHRRAPPHLRAPALGLCPGSPRRARHRSVCSGRPPPCGGVRPDLTRGRGEGGMPAARGWERARSRPSRHPHGCARPPRALPARCARSLGGFGLSRLRRGTAAARRNRGRGDPRRGGGRGRPEPGPSPASRGAHGRGVGAGPPHTARARRARSRPSPLFPPPTPVRVSG